MEALTAIALLVLIISVICYSPVSGDPEEVTYAELQTLGISCYPSDTCQRNETNLEFNIPSCDCDSSCSLYDTCCLDSEYRNHSSPKRKSNMRCLQVYNSPGFEIYMIDTCNTDSSFDNLCSSDPEDSNDPFLTVPVTSNVTGITYRNYFCAVCNEEVDSEQLLFWDMQILINGSLLKNISDPQLNYNKTMESWTVSDGKTNETSNGAFPVILKVQQHSQARVKYCSASLIENCSSNWTDASVALKCRDYMAKVIGLEKVKYRNPHCALCNFENITNLQCDKFDLTAFAVSAFAPFGPVSLDIPLINLFILEDRQKRCGKNMVYDKFADKCRCNSRIYIKENGRCVHRI